MECGRAVSPANLMVFPPFRHARICVQRFKRRCFDPLVFKDSTGTSPSSAKVWSSTSQPNGKQPYGWMIFRTKASFRLGMFL